jgi:diguanylate cyclase (GGDEF)-like protein
MTDAEQRSQRSRTLRVNLRTKLLVAVIAAAAVSMVAQFGLSVRPAAKILSDLETARINESVQVAVAGLNQKGLEMQRLASGHATSIDLAAAVTAHERTWITTHVTANIVDTYHIHGVAVFDDNSRIVASSGASLAGLAKLNLVQGALNKVPSFQIVWYGGDLWLVAAAPIEANGYTAPVMGVLLAGVRIDSQFAQVLSRQTNNDVTFVAKGVVMASSQPIIATLLADPAVAAKLYAKNAIITRDGYTTKTYPLGVAGTQAFIAVSVKSDPITHARTTLFRGLLISLVPVLAMAIGIALLLGLRLGRPLASLHEAVNAIAFGDLSRRVEIKTDDELGDLGRAFNAMADRVSSAQETLRRAAIRDGLTGLYNHREFYRRLHEEASRAERSGSALSILMIDLDFFKRINDNHGHLRGDAVLREAATCIVDSVREGDVVARYAGDEFAVILPHADAMQAAVIGERIRSGNRAILERADLPDDQGFSMSVGVAMRPDGELVAERIVELADNALYRAKDAGRNRVMIDEPPD